jgi:uncharacterized protein
LTRLRLLVDVLHPAHVHFFRPLAEQVVADGGAVLFTGRHKEVTVDLLRAHDLPHEIHSAIGGGAPGLARELATRAARLARTCRRFRPDVLVGVMGPTIAPVGRLLRIPSLVCYDTETAVATNSWVFPLATRVLVPRAWSGGERRNMVRYDGYQELAYLHPDRFAPEPAVLTRLGLDEPFALVRLVSWEASHDLGDSGFGDPVAFVQQLSASIRVVVSAERGVPAALRPLQLTLPPQDLHHVLAGASLVVGEGATTAVEAAVLGTPAVFVHTAELGYVRELCERFELLYVETKQARALARSLELVRDPAATAEAWAGRRQRMLDASIDVTARLHDEVRALARR